MTAMELQIFKSFKLVVSLFTQVDKIGSKSHCTKNTSFNTVL